MAKVTSSTLQLHLSRKISSRPPSNRLSLAMNRRLGAIEDQKQKRKMNGAMNFHCPRNTPASLISHSHELIRNGELVANHYDVKRQSAQAIVGCRNFGVRGFFPLSNITIINRTITEHIKQCYRSKIRGFVPLDSVIDINVSKTIGYLRFSNVALQAVARLHHRQPASVQPVINLGKCDSFSAGGKPIVQALEIDIQPAVPVPCRFYPIPEKPEPQKPSVCKIRPSSNRLPLAMNRRIANRPPSNQLPLPLMCWHDELPKFIPTRSTYIVLNTVTATIGGISVSPISFTWREDMNSATNAGSVKLCQRDYEKIKAKLDVPKGSEPLIIVNVNGTSFAFVAEKPTRTREFVRNTYDISGNSITTRLGASYAKPQNGLLDQDNYASQIINQQLNGLAVSLGAFEVADWLIPAKQYAVTDKTPLAVIGEIASACGGFVSSHRNDATLSIKKRWRTSAWDLSSATPDVIIPFSIGRRISEQPRNSTRFNVVNLSGSSEGGIVYRQLQSRDAPAPAQDNPLYTAKESIIPAGEAILSESGKHIDYTMTLGWSDKYNIPLAALGQIWQVNDSEGHWRAVVKSVDINVQTENDAPTVWQTVGLDRYNDA